MNGRRLSAMLAVAAIAGFVVFGLRSSHGKRQQAAPELPTSALMGHPITLGELRGKPTVVNFFASWCRPCHAEAPGLRDLSDRLRGRANVVGVDWSDNPADGRSFAHQFGWTFPTLSDPDGIVGRRYGITGLPVTFVLDARGRIADVLRGQQSETAVLRAIRGA